MLSVLLNVGIAVLATVIVLGPVGALLWHSWRNVLAAAMLFTAFGLVMISLMAAGQSGWTPGQSARLLLFVAVILAAGLAWGAWMLANGTVAAKVVTVTLSIVALGWVIALWEPLRDSWKYAGDTGSVDFLLAQRNREANEAGSQRSADRMAEEAMLGDSIRRASGLVARDEPHPARDGFLLLRDAADAPQQLTFRENLDVAYVGDTKVKSSRRFLEFLEDDRLSSYRAGRELVLLTGWRGDEKLERMHGVRVLRIPLGAPVKYGITPGFFEPSSATFRHGPYRWMKDILRIPKAERDAIYSKHFGKIPE